MGIVVTIEKMGVRGVGIARHAGKVVMVEFAAPGDKAEVEIIRRHRQYDEGRIVRLLEPSSLRREAPCPYYGRCGGCQLQHIGLNEQRTLKETLFREMLLHRKLVAEEVIAPLRCPSSELAYRAHLELHLSRDGEPSLGFMGRREGQKVTRVDVCVLALPLLQSALARFQGCAARGCLQDLDRVALSCDAPGDSVFCCLMPARRWRRWSLNAPNRDFPCFPSLRGLVVLRQDGRVLEERRHEGDGIYGTRYGIPLPGSKPDVELEVWPGVFRQANPEGNRTLVSLVLEYTDRGPHHEVADLYAGVGNFSIPLSYLADRVTAVEGNGRAVENGRANCQRWGNENVCWHAGNVKTVLGNFIAVKKEFDLVVMDPPRGGAWGILDELITLRPERIIYVSCDPATLVRDLGVLQTSGHYRTLRIQPVDMFPQTFHLESIALLERA